MAWLTRPVRISRSFLRTRRRAPRWLRICLTAAFIIIAAPAPLTARTVVVGIERCDRAAVIHAEAPRLSWAGHRHTRHQGDSQPEHDSFVTTQVAIDQHSALLMRFDLDHLPADQRIVHAELIVPVRRTTGNQPRFYTWRILAAWGPGVSHKHREVRFNREEQTYEKLPWARPGARGIASDRSARPSEIVRVPEDGATVKTLNVTEDVELWYDGRAPNHGWLFTVEDPESAIFMESPIYQYADRWALRITYEPRDP